MALSARRAAPAFRTAWTVAARRLGASALLVACLSTCDFFTIDVFPRWTDYIEAKVDLRAAAAAADIGSLKAIERLERLPYIEGGAEAAVVGALLYGSKGSALLVLDGVTLEVLAAYRRGSTPALEQLGPPLGATVAGFVCGSLAFDPRSLSSAPESISAAIPEGDARIFADRQAGHNYYLREDTLPGLKILEYGAGYELLFDNPARPYTTEPTGYRLLDAELTAGSFRVLVGTDAGSYALGFADRTAFLENSPLLESSGVEKTGPLRLYHGRAWLTAGGLIAYQSDQWTRLERYAYGASVEPIDELRLDGSGLQIVDFEAGGRYWYLYDEISGRLYALRTWWP